MSQTSLVSLNQSAQQDAQQPTTDGKTSTLSFCLRDSAFTWNSVFESENFTTTTNLSFYTKKLENVAQGNYIVRVDTIGSDGKVLYQTSRSVTVAEKESEAEVFSSNSSGTVNNFLQSLLKSIFGN